ncbi:MAG: peptidyl-prolyl cis-trans isomerase [Candidatus Neomarinimicrobiota bacterium]
MRIRYLIFFTLLFSFSLCSKSKDQYIARVGNVYLNQEDLIKMLPDGALNKNLTKNHLNSIVSSWVNKEILYQKARQYHFDREEGVRAQVADFYRDLTIDSYVRYFLQTSVTISEDEIRDYYLKNKNSFIRDCDESKITHVLVQEFNDAMAIKSALLTHNKNDLDSFYSKYNFETIVVKRGESLSEIDQNIFETRPRTIIGPIASPYGFHIVEVLARYSVGSTRTIDEVRDEINQLLTRIKIQERYDVLVDSLIHSANYEIKDENITNFLSNK